MSYRETYPRTQRRNIAMCIYHWLRCCFIEIDQRNDVNDAILSIVHQNNTRRASCCQLELSSNISYNKCNIAMWIQNCELRNVKGRIISIWSNWSTRGCCWLEVSAPPPVNCQASSKTRRRPRVGYLAELKNIKRIGVVTQRNCNHEAAGVSSSLYVSTAAGWRFFSTNVVSFQEIPNGRHCNLVTRRSSSVGFISDSTP